MHRSVAGFYPLVDIGGMKLKLTPIRWPLMRVLATESPSQEGKTKRRPGRYLKMRFAGGERVQLIHLWGNDQGLGARLV